MLLKRLTVLLFAASTAVVARGECLVLQPETHPLYRYTSRSDRQWLAANRDHLCTTVGAKKAKAIDASRIMDAAVLWCAVCSGKVPNKSFLQSFEGQPHAQAMSLACSDFCGRVSTANVVSRARWFRIEWFCQYTRYGSDPAIFGPVAVPPSWQRLERLSDSLCSDLRSGKLSIDDAAYLWTQEKLWWEKHGRAEVDRELHRDSTRYLQSALEFLVKGLSLLK